MTGGEKLRACRRAKGLTAIQVSAVLGISQPTISRIETGKQRPDWKTMDKIIAFTDGVVTPNDFLSAAPADASPKGCPA
jgi:transcriptional regulator with XRE-family HTH domain